MKKFNLFTAALIAAGLFAGAAEAQANPNPKSGPSRGDMRRTTSQPAGFLPPNGNPGTFPTFPTRFDPRHDPRDRSDRFDRGRFERDRFERDRYDRYDRSDRDRYNSDRYRRYHHDHRGM